MEAIKTQRHTGEALQNKAQQDFLDYIYTLQILKLRLKGIDDDDFVHINFKEIEKRFFPFPKYRAKDNIEFLKRIEALEVKVTKSPDKRFTMYLYRGLRPCAFRPDLIQKETEKLGFVSQKMRESLKNVSLKQGTQTNKYFESFLKHKENYIELFFTKDDFSGRVHTPITNLSSEARQNILIAGEETVSIDVATMQPLVLSKILKEYIGENQFTTWIETGEDIYQKFSEVLNLGDRGKGKKRCFEIFFAPPSNELSNIFGDALWIKWINRIKQIPIEGNKYTNTKRYNNLSWLLQKMEVKIMQQVWLKLYENQIIFLSVHDEIIVKKSDLELTEDILHSVFSANFKYYKFNIH